MKRFHTIKTIALATLLLAIGTMAKAQSNQQVMVKEWRDGDYIVRRYIVADNTPHQAEYEIHYAINSATTATDFDQNGAEIGRLDSFFNQLKSDTLRHVSSIAITGYASPDGTPKHNSDLARKRAQQLGEMIAQRYNLSVSNIAVTSHVEPWSATTDAIEHSSLKNRNELVTLVNSDKTPMAVDYQLKGNSTAWQWLKSDVLPDMRRAVVTISYTEDGMQDKREYAPSKPTTREIIVVEEIEVPKHHRKDYKEVYHKEAERHDTKHHKEDKHKRKVVILNEWEGVIIDLGAATEGYAEE